MEKQTESSNQTEFQSRLLNFANYLFQTMGYQIECSTSVMDGMLFLDFSGRDANELTENRFEVLRAVEYLLNKIFQADVNERGMINCDVSGKRQTRMTELQLIARAAAEKVRQSRLPFKLNPMDSRERRIVHLALADDQTIRTESEGEGEYRKVVIYPVE
jgi:spoIIIJ-associated protein